MLPRETMRPPEAGPGAVHRCEYGIMNHHGPARFAAQAGRFRDPQRHRFRLVVGEAAKKWLGGG